jgi:hypothetical protein
LFLVSGDDLETAEKLRFLKGTGFPARTFRCEKEPALAAEGLLKGEGEMPSVAKAIETGAFTYGLKSLRENAISTPNPKQARRAGS